MRLTHSYEDSAKFVNALREEALSSRAVQHEYLDALVDGRLPDPATALADLAYQYLPYSSDFPRYLTAAIAQLNDRSHRDMLIANLLEEDGKVDEGEAAHLRELGIDIDRIQGAPHSGLFRRYLDALGMTDAWRQRCQPCMEAKVWSRLFLMVCSSGGEAQAVGAIGLGTEIIVSDVYRQIRKAIEGHLDIRRDDRVFFDLHINVDNAHGQTFMRIATELAQGDKHRGALRAGVLMALSLRAAFFDAMNARARRMRPRSGKRPNLDEILSLPKLVTPDDAVT